MPSPEGYRPAGPPIYSAPPGPYRLRQGGWRVSAGKSYAENQCAGAGLVLW
jgi:hypothetical protein